MNSAFFQLHFGSVLQWHNSRERSRHLENMLRLSKKIQHSSSIISGQYCSGIILAGGAEIGGGKLRPSGVNSAFFQLNFGSVLRWHNSCEGSRHLENMLRLSKRIQHSSSIIPSQYCSGIILAKGAEIWRECCDRPRAFSILSA